MYTIEVSRVIDAPISAVYAILADYRVSHPAILPKAFTGIEVEQGGRGAGTIAHAHLSVMGQQFHYRLVVSEPQPGRVLQEVDEAAGVWTTFTCESLALAQTRLTIASQFRESAGIKGRLEKMMSPGIARRMYREELENIAVYVRAH